MGFKIVLGQAHEYIMHDSRNYAKPEHMHLMLCVAEWGSYLQCLVLGRQLCTGVLCLNHVRNCSFQITSCIKVHAASDFAFHCHKLQSSWQSNIVFTTSLGLGFRVYMN